MRRVFTYLTIAALATASMQSGAVVAAESTMPPDKYPDIVRPDLASLYRYTEDGDFTKSLNIPTYEWMPANQPPRAIVLGIHGLTLHGRRYRVLARTLALGGIGFVAMDMRGFGKCFFDDQNKFSTAADNKKKISHEKSYGDLVLLAGQIKQKYGDLPIIALGESLGCTFAIKLGAEHPELIKGMMLSAPAVRVNPRMYASPADIGAGLKAIATGHKMNLHQFMTHLVSPRPEVSQEMLDDPYVLKELSLLDLISTDEFVEKTTHFGAKVSNKMPIWILQGSADGCVAPKHLTDLLMAMPSDDQQISWKGKFGHLQLETSFMRATVIADIIDWLQDHSKESLSRVAEVQKSINDLGGILVN